MAERTRSLTDQIEKLEARLKQVDAAKRKEIETLKANHATQLDRTITDYERQNAGRDVSQELNASSSRSSR